MKYFLAVDSGGTKTNAVLFDQNGVTKGCGYGGSGNALLSDSDSAVANVYDACVQAIAQSKIDKKDIVKCSLFIPAFRECLAQFQTKIRLRCELLSESDELRYAAFGREDGIVVLAGTGSFATAYVGENRYSVGGWGTIFGDEGSGYDIGVMALKKCARDYDLGVNGELSSVINQRLGIENFSQARKIIYKAANSRKMIAGLCKDVCELAKNNDKNCGEIILEAANRLVGLALDCLTLSGQKSMNVCLQGGLSSAGAIITEPFGRRLVQLSQGRLSYVESKFDIITGAKICALLRENIEVKY